MPSLEQAVGARERRSLRSLLGVTLFLGGVVLVAVGLLSVVHSVLVTQLAPTAAALWAATITGLLLPTLLCVLTLRLNGWVIERELGLGSGLAVAGLGLLWITAPSGWAGAPTPAVAPAFGTYALGLLTLVVGFASAGVAPGDSGRAPTSEPAITVSRTTERPPSGSAALGDGGDDDSDLTYLLDEDDSDGKRRR